MSNIIITVAKGKHSTKLTLNDYAQQEVDPKERVAAVALPGFTDEPYILDKAEKYDYEALRAVQDFYDDCIDKYNELISDNNIDELSISTFIKTIVAYSFVDKTCISIPELIKYILKDDDKLKTIDEMFSYENFFGIFDSIIEAEDVLSDLELHANELTYIEEESCGKVFVFKHNNNN